MRKLSAPLYVIAFIVTLAIFGVGIYVGTILEGIKQNSIRQDVAELNSDVGSLGILFLLENSTSFCPLYEDTLEKLDEKSERIGEKLSYLEEAKEGVDPDLKREYFALQTQSLLLSQTIEKQCGKKQATVVYFYSNKNCPECVDYGIRLSSARRESKNPGRIYTFDGDIGESAVVDSLKLQYNITRYPSVVVNGKTLVNPAPNDVFPR